MIDSGSPEAEARDRIALIGFAETERRIAQLKRELEEGREEKEEAGYAMGHWQIIAQDAEARVKELENEVADVRGEYWKLDACAASLSDRLAALISAAKPIARGIVSGDGATTEELKLFVLAVRKDQETAK